MLLLAGSGMNRVVKMVMDGQRPIRGRYVVGSPLITEENAAEHCFPDLPY